MLKTDRLSLLSIFLALVFAGIFYYTNHIQISQCSIHSDTLVKESIDLPYSKGSQGKHDYIYECNIDSNIAQNVKLGIAVDDSFDALYVNSTEVSLEYLHDIYSQETLVDWNRGYPVVISLDEGSNHIKILGRDSGGRLGLKIGMAYDYGEYLFLFIFCIIPFVFGLYYLVFDRIFETNWRKVTASLSWKHLPYLFIILGIALRLFMLTSVSNTMYQHDFGGHVDTIKHYAQHPLEIPQNDKSLQFPQQPLYYMSSAIVYSISTALGFSNYDAIYAVRSLSVFYAALWLLLSLALARLYLKNDFSINIFMAFMAFTPSFIFLGAVVNNDALNALLGVWALYEISSYLIKKNQKYFWRASLAILLAALTKISSLLFAIYFVIILLVMYYQNGANKPVLKRQILLFGLSILFLFGFALSKSYIPTTAEFLFVNSALYSNQIIPEFSLAYFFSFHWLSLIDEGQSYVMGIDTIRYSLPTYFYGTMYIGEFNFARHFKVGEFFKLSSQLIFLFGIIYIIGLASFFYFHKYLSSLQKYLVIPILINLLLIIKFLSDYWVVCNSDFRYFTPTIAAIGLLFVIGINAFTNKFEWAKKPTIFIVTLLALSEIYWVVQLIEKT